ncbi:hypothetical protein G1C96_0759 [Bifidobacterium sp. DSM 109958]|uniref:DUF559 domain-containing protein n=1 Tax=Bifidobacterium moraviense TaxID=2675323 RepID=A0A7Y0F344_9BIFI|nr:hypothetical protein [Bifidobacterium sp. DSM 109958]NMN00182.1 hypothetical protein [Bifidobacterium sp. DSM 109958]
MYEFTREPAPNHLMRHQAWETQRAAIERCRAIMAPRPRRTTAAATTLTGRAGTEGPAAATRASNMPPDSPVFALGTALNLLGLQVPRSYASPGDRPVIVFDAPRALRRVPGTRPVTWSPLATPHAVIDVDGVRCTSPAATFAHMARFCSLEHLVAIGDAMACRDATMHRAGVDVLRGFVDAAGRFVGRPNAVRALRLVRERVDSPAETRLRLLATRFGLPCPEPDVIIAVEPTKIRIDMGWPRYRIGLDYQGAHHRAQYEDDLYRANAILTHRWTVFQVTAGMIGTKEGAAWLFAQVAQALAHAGADVGPVRDVPMSVWQISNERGGRPTGR